MLAIKENKSPSKLGLAVVSVIISVSLVLSSCTCGSGKQIKDIKPTPLTTTTITGTIELPGNLSLAGQKIVNSLGTASVGNNGQFKLKAVANSRQFTIVESASGNPMLLGWPDGQHQEINARTTAEVLVYMATGLFLLPGAAQTNAMDVLATSPQLDGLEKAIEEALAQDPEVFGKPNEAVDKALSDVIAGLFPSSMAMGTTIKDAYFAILVNPTESKSGLTVNTTEGINSVFLTNRYRRPGHCFIDRVSTYDAIGGETLSPADLTDFEVKEITGVNSLTPTLTDIAKGNLAYKELSTDPVSLTVPEGWAKARYRLCVVGPGASQGNYDDLSDAEKQKYYEVAGKFLMLDLLARFVLQFMIPTDKVDEFVKFFGGTSIFKAIWQYATAILPQAFDQVSQGQIREAFSTIINAYMTSEMFRRQVIQGLIDGIQNAYGLAASSEALAAAENYMGVIKVVDGILVAFDSSVICENVKASNKADVWDITVTQPKVVLRPGTATLVIGEQITFEVTVPEQSGSGVNLVYVWKNTATRGHLTDGIAGHKDEFDSSKNKATYTVESEGEGSDTVTVEVWALAGPAQSLREFVGKASAEIKTPWGQGTINAHVGEYSLDAYYFNWNLMKKGGSSFLDSHWVEQTGYASFGSTQYPFGEYKIVVYAYDMQCKLVNQAACTFTLKSGQKDVWMTFDSDYFVGGEDPMSGVKKTGLWDGYFISAGIKSLNGKGVPAYFNANPGDLVETAEMWENWEIQPGVETFIVGPIYLHSWRDGERYKIFEGGDFSRYFPLGETVVVATQQYVIPDLESILPGPICVLKTKTITPTTPTTPTTSSITPKTTTTTTKPTTAPTTTSTTTPTTTSTTTPTTTPTTSIFPPPTQTIPGINPNGMCSDGTNIWIANRGSNNVTKMRMSDGSVIGTYPVGSGPRRLYYDGTNIWVTNSDSSSVTKLRASDGSLMGTYAIGSQSGPICYDGTNIWVASNASNSVTKIKASDGSIVAGYDVGVGPGAICFDGTNIWAGLFGTETVIGNTVVKLNPSGGTIVGTYTVGKAATGLCYDGTNIWVVNNKSNNVTKLKASDGSVLGTYAVGSKPRNCCFYGSSIWVTNNESNSVTRLKASDGSYIASYRAGTQPFDIIVAGSSIWVTNMGSNDITRLPATP